VVIFDRSWYNRAGVERVMGFCTEEQARAFLQVVPPMERLMVDSGIILIKYWLEVSPDEQASRLAARVDDGRKIWKLSPMDIKSYTRWDDYSKSRDDMFARRTPPWPRGSRAFDDKRGRGLNIAHLLSRILYEMPPREKVKLPSARRPIALYRPR
jgi:polyphosphate kinase 2 (PPK2 family)